MVSLIQADRLLLPDGSLAPGWVRLDDGLIAEVGTGDAGATPDLHAPVLGPGFVDIHCHGGGGASFASTDFTEVARAAATHLRHGTTTLIASLVTAGTEQLAAQVTTLAEATEQGIVVGIHLEGPWLSPLHKGAHDPAHLRLPDPAELAVLLPAARGHLRMVTLAPELPGSEEVTAELVRAGVVVAVGHTDADEVQLRAAVDRGARVVTHLCNAMRPIHHRSPGPVVEALGDDRLTVEVIADGMHVHPTVLDLVGRSARSRVALVTDAMAAAGEGDGRYTLGSLEVTVEDGVAHLADGETIAGSTLTMDRAVQTAVDAGWSLATTLRAATQVPAHALGLPAGEVEVGRPADLVALDDDLAVTAVLRRGKLVTP